jgi:hypothetical protein
MSLNAFAAAWQVDPGSPETDGHRASKSTRKLVLLCLADRANRDTGYAWPSIQTMCDDTGLAESTVRGALHALLELGIIVHDGWAGRGDRQTKRYRMGFHSQVVDNPVDNRNGVHVVANGVHDVAARGPRRGPEPVIEPVKNPQRRPRPVDNSRRPAIRTPEETLAMLEQERQR